MFARIARTIFCLIAVCAGLLPVSGAQAAARNVLLLIADDLGVDATEFYPTVAGNGAAGDDPAAPPMPNLKRLAQQGVLFSNAWGNALCAPARAALFTGRYGFRTGIGSNPTDTNPVKLARSEVILPELFTARPGLDYVLGHVGKWHVSPGMADPNLWLALLRRHLAGKSGVEILLLEQGCERCRHSLDDLRHHRFRQRGTGSDPKGQEPGQAHSSCRWPSKPRTARTTCRRTRSIRATALPPYTAGRAPRPYFEAMTEALDTEIGRLLREGEVDLATTTVIFVGDNGTTKINVAPPTLRKGPRAPSTRPASACPC